MLGLMAQIEDSDTLGAVNHFDRLPHCLIVSIFNRIKIAKTLVLCSSVYKHFASLTPQAQTVVLNVGFDLPEEPTNTANTTTSRTGAIKSFFSNIAAKIKNSLSRNLPPTRDDDDDGSVPHAAAYQVRSKFTEVRDLQVKSEKLFLAPFFNRKLMLKSIAVSGSQFEVYVVLMCTRPHKRGWFFAASSYPDSVPDDELAASIVITKYSLKKMACALLMLAKLANERPMLDDLGYYYGGNRAKVYAGREQIASYRAAFVMRGKKADEAAWEEVCHWDRIFGGQLHMTTWYVPVTGLSNMPGYVTDTLTLAVVGRANEPTVMERDAALLLGAFDDEEGKLCDDIVMEVIRTSNKKTYRMRIPLN